MKLKQTLPYKLKRVVPILGLAGASLFTACEKPVEPDPRHDTVYTWSIIDKSQIIPPERVCASADSAMVRNVILQYDTTIEYCTDATVRYYMEDEVLSHVTPENQHKVRGRGLISFMRITNPEDSLWLANFGFQILNREQSEALYFQR